ncbi:MAG: YbgC/FadM family acyl-CoA thioesterase, partial [Alphaproteobacteria bacterium]|nr:YbgC/FadM family acyl-CoA thioesterase [Alphaproteobacteria bacterium]
DTDAAGIVYYANYLKFIERGRTEMLRLAGFDQQRLLAEKGLVFPVKSCAVEFVRPSRLEDRLEVVTRLAEIGGASLILDQTVRRGAEDIALANVRIACIDGAGKPRRLPSELKEAFARLEKPR